MSNAKISITKLLLVTQIAIDNALADPVLISTLTAYGYTAERLQEGKALREQVLMLLLEQKTCSGDGLAATDDLKSARRQAQRMYMLHVKVARVALYGNRRAARTLDLETQRKRTLPAWLFQARQFYTGALADHAILNALSRYGITQEKLEAGKRLIDAVEACDATRTERKSNAQTATQRCNEALTALDRWISSFRQIARVALQDHPQGLEKLGARRSVGRRTVTL